VVILAHLEAPQQHLPILLVIAEGNNPVMTISHPIVSDELNLKCVCCVGGVQQNENIYILNQKRNFRQV